MSDDARTSPWAHRALNLALVALGMVLVAFFYALVSQHVGGGATPGESAVSSSTAGASAKPSGEAGSVSEIVQVGVRNGCGVSGLAAEARRHLVRSGLDVVEVGNYSSFDVDTSMVIDRVGNRAAARRVARAMGIPPERIRREVSETYYLDATVVIGKDYRSLDPFEAKEGDPASTQASTH